MIKIVRNQIGILIVCFTAFTASAQTSTFEPIPVERADGFYATVDYNTNTPKKEVKLEKEASITLAHIKQVRKTISSYTSRPEIAIELTENGAKIFGILTKENVGKPIAIVINKQIVYLPLVNAEITGGSLVLSGDFTIEELDEIVQRLTK